MVLQLKEQSIKTINYKIFVLLYNLFCFALLISCNSEDTFTAQVEEYKENEFLKASVICNNNPNLSKNIFVELVSDNNREIPN